MSMSTANTRARQHGRRQHGCRLQPIRVGGTVPMLSACALLLCASALLAEEDPRPASGADPFGTTDAETSGAGATEANAAAAEHRLHEHQDRLDVESVDARIERLEQQLAQREAHIERLQAAEARRAEAKHQLEQRLEALRARLPAPEGGTLTAAEARARARADAQTLERLLREGQGVNNPQLWQQIRETEHALHRSQYLLARAEGDRTVYRMRPGDSLAHISAMVYGTDQAWQRIFEANRHLLDDPDRVLPGLTLVIP